MSLWDKLIGREDQEQKRRIEADNARIEREMAGNRQKANQRLLAKKTTLAPQQFKARQQNIMRNGVSANAPVIKPNNMVFGALNTGVKRSIAGLGESGSGLYDLVTPGKGTNRFTKNYRSAGELYDAEVNSQGLNKSLYKTGQFGGELAQILATGGIANAVTKAPKVAQLSSKFGLINKAIQGTGRTAQAGRFVTRPDVMANVASNVAQGSGFRTARDIKNTPQAVALDTAISLALPAVAPLAVEGIKKGVGATVKGITKGGKAYQKATALPNSVKVSDNELYSMSDYADVQMGTNKQEMNGTARNNVTLSARQTADKLGLDITSGSPVEINNRIGKFIEDYKLGQNAKSQTGAIGRDVRVKPVVAPSGLKVQDNYVNDYAKILKESDSGKGGQMIQTPDGYKRISEHSPFYSEFYAKNKRAPSQQDWIAESKRQIESGEAGADFYDYVASDAEALGNNLPNKPSTRMSVVEKESLFSDIPAGTDKQIKVKTVGGEKKIKVGGEAKYPIENIPSSRMSTAERESLYGSVPQGTDKTIKVTNPNTKSNIPVSKVTQEGDVVTKTNVNPNIQKGEKRFAMDDNGNLIEDTNGAYKLFTDEEGRVKNFRIGDKVYNTKDLGDLSDVNDYGSSLATMRRNAERAFGGDTGEKVSKFLVDHQQGQATKMITRQVELKKSMQEIADDLGINFASRTRKARKVSGAIQEYGEGNRSKQSLIDEFGGEQANKIVNADKWFRSQYDSLLNEMNDTLTKFGYAPVPKRKNYYTHFQDNSVWKNFGLKMQEIRNMASPTLQDASPTTTRGNVPNKLAGQTEFLQPNKKFNQFTLQRKGDQTVVDAFQAFERYITPTLNNIYMTPSITRARVLSKAIAQDADIMGKDASLIIRQTTEWANRLAGKTNRFDRAIVDTKMGNKAIRMSQWAQKKAGQNSIIGNLATAVMQPIVLTQTSGKFGYKNTILGLLQMMSGKDRSSMSPFMRRRYADVSPVTAGKMDVARDIANTPLEFIEENTARATWNSAYNDAVSQGVKGSNAVRYADVQSEKTLAGRAIGEKPELFESKSAGLATMYQLEVSNFWQQFGKEMSKSQAAKTMVAAYGLNLVLQEVTGRQVGFNPIDAVIDSYEETKKEDKSIVDKTKTIGKRWAGEVVDNTPFVGPVANFAIGDKKLRNLLGEDSNVGRFGVSSPVSTLVNNPEDLLLPFGGSQLRKTYSAYQTLRDKGLSDKNDKQILQVNPSTSSTVKGLLFGKNAIPEVNTYYDNLGKKKVDQKEIPNQTPKVGAVDGQVPITDKTEKGTDGKYTSRDKYDAILHAYEGGKYEKNIGTYSSDEFKTAIKDVANEAKKEFETAGLPTDGIKFDSINARDYASFKKGIEGKDELSARKATESFLKDTYKTRMDEVSKSFYTLGDDEMRYELNNGTISKEQMDKIIETDNLLTSEGLQDYMQVGKELREDLGYGIVDVGSGKSSYAVKATKSGKGGKKGKKPTLFNFTDIGLLKSTNAVNLVAKAPSVKKATVKRGRFAKKA